MRRLFWPLLLLLTTGSSLAATLRLSVTGPAATTKTSEPALGFSSTDRLTLKITLDQKTFDDATANAGTGSIFVLKATDKDQNDVPVRQWFAGQSVVKGLVTTTLLIEISIDPAERTRQLSHFADEMIAQATDSRMKEMLIKERQTSIAALDHMFVQNRVGSFILHLAVGNAINPIAETKKRIRIADTGTFVERIRISGGRTQ